MNSLHSNPWKGDKCMSIFNELFDAEEANKNFEVEKQEMKESQEQMTLMAQGHFLQISEKYRRQMNEVLSFVEKYKIALELIRALTGDELFYITHMKDVGAIPEDSERMREGMQEALVIDATRRIQIHEYRYQKDKTQLNEFIYQSALIDLELLAIERDNYKSEQAYEDAMQEKILEKQSLTEVYRAAIRGGEKNVS